MLICPKCKEALHKQNNRYLCSGNHSFDIAKRGYVNLLLGNHKGSGDDKEMIASRHAFLTNRYYQILCDKLIEILKQIRPNVLIDAGCGEGYYTNQFKDALSQTAIYGFDLSKHGVDEACKAHKDITYAVANVFHLPFADDGADALISIFAPFDIQEVARVLKNDGYFVKVGPGSDHLMELKKIIYNEVYENEMNYVDDEQFELVNEVSVHDSIHVTGCDDIWALFQMTPYYWKSPKEGSERLKQMDTLDTRISFQIEIYKKKSK